MQPSIVCVLLQQKQLINAGVFCYIYHTVGILACMHVSAVIGTY